MRVIDTDVWYNQAVKQMFSPLKENLHGAANEQYKEGIIAESQVRSEHSRSEIKKN